MQDFQDALNDENVTSMVESIEDEDRLVGYKTIKVLWNAKTDASDHAAAGSDGR